MSFREKAAWIVVLTYLAGYGYYFWVVAGAMAAAPIQGIPFMDLLLKLIVLLVIVQVFLTIVVAVVRPKDAKAPIDEREKLISLKATRNAFHVVMIGTICTCTAIALGAPAFYTVNALLLSIILAELTRYSGHILYYRHCA